VHRDISINNILRVVKDGSQIGKLTDFEYAKKKDSTTSHEVRTVRCLWLIIHISVAHYRQGTLDFMAVEVESQGHLFLPDDLDPPPEEDDMMSESDSIFLPNPPFQMNPIHDLESLWWCTIWILLYHTDVHSPAEDMNAQQAFLQIAFPPQPERLLRLRFLTSHPLREQARKTLSKTYRNKCASIFFKLPDTLKRHYKALESNYPALPFNFPSDDALESLHQQVFDVYEHIINELDGSGAPQVRLQSLLDLIKERKEAVEDSGSDQPAKKKARQA
jgi:serine/threonine protein kinase